MYFYLDPNFTVVFHADFPNSKLVEILPILAHYKTRFPQACVAFTVFICDPPGVTSHMQTTIVMRCISTLVYTNYYCH